jgi:MFS family permease
LAIIVEGILQYNNIIALLVCRIIQGIFVGYYMSIVPIYINELAPRQIIGRFGVFTQLFVMVGVVVSYALSLILSACNAEAFVFYRVMLLFNVLLILAQTILLLVGFIP